MIYSMKTVLITDVEHNFGPALAQAFAREGATVVTGDCDRTLVDIVINNVLLPTEPQAFAQISFDTWKRKIEADLTGSFFLFRSILPNMIRRRYGRVINFTGRRTDTLSSSTERGMIGMTLGLAREYARYNITANCIGVGDAQREQGITLLALTLASENSAHITGQCIFTQL